MKKNMIVGQSGGPTAVINGSLYGVVLEAFEHDDMIGQIYGMLNGIEGLLNRQFLKLSALHGSKELDLLKTTPGSYLGSCRYRLPEDLSDPVYPQIFEIFDSMQIGYFLYIGGNDSMDTVSKLSRYAQTIESDICFLGLPKTIDNDLVLTDHTPGFASAAKYVATTVREISMDAAVYHNTQSVTIIEIMGRHAGWLAAASALARKNKTDNPVLIYLPEVSFNEEDFLDKIRTLLPANPNLVVCISEGIHDCDGVFLCEKDQTIGTDNFGHKMLTGSGKYLENLVRERLGIKVRSVELNVAQRCSSICLSLTDLNEAIASGQFGVRAILDGATGKMVTFCRTSSAPYTLTCSLEDVSRICNQEKTIPLEWIIKDDTDVSDAFLRYLSPLIQGEVTVPMHDGLPVFASTAELPDDCFLR